MRTPEFLEYVQSVGGPAIMSEQQWQKLELFAFTGQVVGIRQRPGDEDDPLIKVRWYEGRGAIAEWGKCVVFA